MKVITIKKKNILKTTIVVIFALVICGFSTSFGMQHYYTVDFYTGIGVVSSSKYGKIFVQMFIGK